MTLPDLTKSQLSIIEGPLDRRIFLEGRAGVGKTTCGVERMLHLMSSGVPGNSILVLVPQRILGQPYIDALQTPGVTAGGRVSVLTLGGLARRSIELFWSTIAEKAGFAYPGDPPIFLSLETALYFMAKVVDPLLKKGYFDTVTISRNRMFSQILDNLNKAALVGFPHTLIGEKLANSWIGDPGQLSVYQDVQESANEFRAYCLANNLLDFSLQIEIFTQCTFPEDTCKNYLMDTYQHIIADNLEENVPVSHDLLHEWLPKTQSSLMIFDQNAGYRSFLGADPISGYRLKDSCDDAFELKDSFVVPSALNALSFYIGKQLQHEMRSIEDLVIGDEIAFIYERFFPQMLDEVSKKIAYLVNEQDVPPGEIAVLAPFLSDALRFSFSTRLQEFNIPIRTHRPSRSLQEEPATKCLLTLAALAHPLWDFSPTNLDVANALLQAIEGLDPVRAHLLTQIVYQRKDPDIKLSSFERIIPESQERITYPVGAHYEKLRLWLLEYSQHSRGSLDHFLNRLYEEVLSQPGFGFHLNYDAGDTITNLIDSIMNFREAAGPRLQEEGISVGNEYVEMVQGGILAAQYLESWQLRPGNAVLVAPAYTFLLSNQPVDVQFWLDIGNRAWGERIYQPLTHPYVLSRSWPPSAKWTDSQEVETGRLILYRLTSGLINRCRKKIFFGVSEFNEQGYEQRGPLLRALHRVLIETSIRPK